MTERDEGMAKRVGRGKHLTMLGRRFPAADCGLRAISAEQETALELHGEEEAAGATEAAAAAAGDELGTTAVEGAAEMAEGRTEAEVGEGRSPPLLAAAIAAAPWWIRPE